MAVQHTQIAGTHSLSIDDVEVSMFIGDDGAIVVQVDGTAPRVRVNLNDAAIYDGNPDTDEAPGPHVIPSR